MTEPPTKTSTHAGGTKPKQLPVEVRGLMSPEVTMPRVDEAERKLVMVVKVFKMLGSVH